MINKPHFYSLLSNTAVFLFASLREDLMCQANSCCGPTKYLEVMWHGPSNNDSAWRSRERTLCKPALDSIQRHIGLSNCCHVISRSCYIHTPTMSYCINRATSDCLYMLCNIPALGLVIYIYMYTNYSGLEMFCISQVAETGDFYF